MPEEKDNPIWSLVIWGGGAVAGLGYGLWCVYDGWFHEGFKHAETNRFMAPVCFLAAVWCVWRGIKEYKTVASGEGGQGLDTPDAPPESSAPTADQRDRGEE